MTAYTTESVRPEAGAVDGGTLTVAFYCDASIMGGAEVSLANLLSGLSARVDAVVMGTDRKVVDWLAGHRPTAKSVHLPPIRSKRNLGAIAAHFRAIRRLRPDILQVNLSSPWSSDWATIAGLMARHVRVVAVEHMPQPIPHVHWRLLKRVTSTRLAAHVTVGEQSASDLARYAGVHPSSIRTIHNGVPDLDVEPLPRLSGGPVIGAVGRLEHQKGFELLLHALPELPGVTAVIVGDGAERDRLAGLAERLGVSDRLILTGWSNEPRRYLSGFDVLVLPSRFEGGPPLVVIEAMLAGLSVVATRIGNVSEAVVHGDTGLLVPPEDPHALASALSSLMADPARRQEMGTRARELARQRFSVTAMASAYEALYDEVVR